MTAAFGLLVAGGVLLMAGVRNRSIGDILRGITSPVATSSGTSTLTSLIGPLTGVAGSGGTPDANRKLGRAMMLAAGFSADQWPCLDKLWTQESGWDANVTNPTSGAAGIPQALGHGHVFNLGDARAQIAWGLSYIRGRYGTPCAAWAHEQANNWY